MKMCLSLLVVQEIKSNSIYLTELSRGLLYVKHLLLGTLKTLLTIRYFQINSVNKFYLIFTYIYKNQNTFLTLGILPDMLCILSTYLLNYSYDSGLTSCKEQTQCVQLQLYTPGSTLS